MNITANSVNETSKATPKAITELISDENSKENSQVNSPSQMIVGDDRDYDDDEADIAKFSKFTLIGQTLILKKSSPRFREDSKSGRKNSNDHLICIYCKTRSSRTWRKGPDGKKSLCNSCGLRYYRLLVKERKIQPANTPNPIHSILN